MTTPDVVIEQQYMYRLILGEVQPLSETTLHKPKTFMKTFWVNDHTMHMPHTLTGSFSTINLAEIFGQVPPSVSGVS